MPAVGKRPRVHKGTDERTRRRRTVYMAEEPTKKAPADVFTNRRARTVVIVLTVVMVVAACISLLLGRYPIAPGDALAMLANLLPFVDIETGATPQAEALFYNVRLPRILLALLVGCCLSAAGAAFQGTFQNPLTSPDILGASQGAALGAAIAILLGWGSVAISGMAFVFAIIAVLLVLIVSSRARGNKVLVVVLSGVMISSLMSAGVSFTKLIADPANTLPAITYWLMGSLTSANLRDIAMVIAPMGIGLIALFLMRWRINILTMGDEEAETLGVNTKVVRLVVILAATLVTAASVSVTGMIGWVGLVVPHLCRMLVGADYRKLLPASMVMGAGFLLLVDDVSRLVTTAEIPIGILTAFIGAPFFLYLITRRKHR